MEEAYFSRSASEVTGESASSTVQRLESFFVEEEAACSEGAEDCAPGSGPSEDALSASSRLESSESSDS
eukprot:566226-Hanusia_phi.AAC.1